MTVWHRVLVQKMTVCEIREHFLFSKCFTKFATTHTYIYIYMQKQLHYFLVMYFYKVIPQRLASYSPDPYYWVVCLIKIHMHQPSSKHVFNLWLVHQSILLHNQLSIPDRTDRLATACMCVCVTYLKYTDLFERYMSLV